MVFYQFKITEIMKNIVYLKSRILIGILVLSAITIISNGCSKSKDNSGPGPNEVWIQGMNFEPNTITISSGTTITWSNRDAVSHTVTSNSGLFDSGTIPKDGTYQHTFTSAGTFPYHCSIHPTMTATIVVN